MHLLVYVSQFSREASLSFALQSYNLFRESPKGDTVKKSEICREISLINLISFINLIRLIWIMGERTCHGMSLQGRGELRRGGAQGSELEFAAEGGVGGIDAAIDAAEHNPYG